MKTSQLPYKEGRLGQSLLIDLERAKSEVPMDLSCIRNDRGAPQQ